MQQGLSGYACDEVLERRPWGFRLADVEANVTVWHGDQDQYTPRPHVEAMVGRLRRARAEFYPDLAHWQVPPSLPAGEATAAHAHDDAADGSLYHLHGCSRGSREEWQQWPSVLSS